MTCASSGRPASACSTLGSRERMRLPSPAARMMTFKDISNYLTGQTTYIPPKPRLLPDIQVQSRLRAAPEDILRLDRPLAHPQIVDLERIEVRPEVDPEILDFSGGAENSRCARAVSVHECAD